MAEADRQPLRILCFGDSLTAGYTSMGTRFHPYSRKLKEMVAMAFPDRNVEAVADGRSGDTVSYGFVSRMQRNFRPKKTTGNESFYDWTIVLGGTNDLAYGIKPEDIFEKLKDVYGIAFQHGSKVLALTVPECGLRVDPRRNKLNDLIKGYKRDNYYVYDLDAAIPYFAMSSSDRGKYWDDAIHFSVDGYNLIGNKVGMSIVKILEEDVPKAAAPPKKRRVFRDDDKVFVEEDGDPTALDQGYVVVRRKDLD